MSPRPFWQTLKIAGSPVFAVLISLIVAMIVLGASGYNPLHIFRGLEYSFFTRHGIINTLAMATPLILTAITWAVGARAGVFNVGAEGTLMIGAVAALAAGALLKLPVGLHHLVVLAAAVVAGVLWTIPVAYLKTKRNVHEVVSTIMLNWVASFLVSFLVVWPLRDPEWPMRSLKILPTARFHPLVAGTNLTLVFFISIAFAIFSYLLLWHTRVGQHIRATGFNPDVAKNCGINVSLVTVFAFGVGGAAAGLAGYALTAGLPPLWSISEKLGTLVGYGFNGICVAAIGANHPIGIIFAAIFFGGVLSSRSYMQMFLGIAPEITDVIAGVIVLILALPELSKIFLGGQRKKVVA
ncbi:MAG: ral nucleoside transport system permease protein [Candidatus Atribacteria bacterium]|nr:ral nucleoside transport system permease protein [Candidatus Atribacteria bacterium]